MVENRMKRYLIILLFILGIIPQTALAVCLSPNGDNLLCETREVVYESDEGIELKEKAKELGTPAKIYEYLRNNSEYAPYHGARSNSINSFLSLRGNDVDLSSTLIAMFRSQGIKSRYATGNIRISKVKLANWLGVINTDLAVAILRDQGIQNIDNSDPETVVFEHTWVQALISYSNYRGANLASETQCLNEGETCRWVSLDASFKQKIYKEAYRMLLRNLSFDFKAYYNAQNPSSPDYKAGMENKSPLEIFEEKALAYLRSQGSGVTLEDIIDKGEIIADESGLVPASLPYEVTGPVKFYNSVDDHDSEEEIKWTKYLRSRILLPGCDNNGGILPSVEVTLAELSTKQLTVTTFLSDEQTVIFGHRLDGKKKGMTLQITGSVTLFCNDIPYIVDVNRPVDLELEVDVEPGQEPVKTRYNNLMIGGYYLIATGGETSNMSQVRRASQRLLKANKDWPIVVDTAGAIGESGLAYVDVNGNNRPDSYDIALLDHLEAQDALTGGLLNVAAMLYYTKLREDSERYSRLKGIISPISAYLGVVSTTHEVEYLDNVPFSVTPGGLLIDLKGIRLNGSWEIDQPETYSSETFLFLGHIGSSLEHEIWQIITGYDAISTVRGIQFAMEQGHKLLDIRKNSQGDTYPASLLDLGFSNAPPPDYIQHDYNLFGRQIVSWGYTGDDLGNAAFHTFRPNVDSLNSENDATRKITYWANNHINDFLSSYDLFENELIQDKATEGQLKTNEERTHFDSDYQIYDVVQAKVDSPAGFTLGNYYRSSPNEYKYIINETVNHPDGVYAVAIDVKLSDSVDLRTMEFTGLQTYTVTSVTVESPAGFTVTNYSKVNDSCFVTIGESGNHTNGTYPIVIKFILVRNGSIYTWKPSFEIEIVNNRFVDAILNDLTVSIDVSDDQSMSCSGGPDGSSVEYTGTPTELLVNLEHCFNNVIEVDELESFLNFFDRGHGFNPNTYAYRDRVIGLNEYDIDFILGIRSNLYWRPAGETWFQYLLPNRLSMDTHYLFSVYLENGYSDSETLAQSTYAIVNHSDLLASGGGYVTAVETLEQSEDPKYNNQVFTDVNLISVSNNDVVRTPSTSDPVSTVTGNMYHDETDFTIKGRGLDFVFTRSYNSGPARSEKDGTLGFGWTHSYAMTLESIDDGDCPNCASSQKPENDNGVTASISYVDERGGEHTFLVDESTLAITPPFGEFDQLQLDLPGQGQYTMTFRNGVRYIFEGPADLKTIPGRKARLAKIIDSFGNELVFTYSDNKLVSIIDNIGLESEGRSGLTFIYNTDGRLETVNDWTGRSWSYSYSNGNLTGVAGPIGSMTYTYHPGTHLLDEMIHPADRKRQTG
nr:hypothetical protein [Desulfobacula sp.]